MELQNTIGGTTYTVVVVESSGEVLAIPNKDVTSKHIKEFQTVPCGRGVYCLGVTGKTDCYLNFDGNGMAANACRDGAVQDREEFSLQGC